ncbi:MAG TPA: hypothetical protein DCY13_25125 [Verrucomicrobiales bacterium]|nr:hypothetical protein [Verrucomicrobiales bacterium]
MSFAFDQFGELVGLQDGQGRPLVIIGGQAVNLWSTRYEGVEPDLQRYRPFTSKDLDFQGTLNDVWRIAKRFGVQPLLPHKKLMTAFVGAIRLPVGSQLSQIEFVRRVPGVQPAKVERLAVEVQFANVIVRVIDPISLLISKSAMVFIADQEGRHDLDHVQMLLLCVRAYLREALEDVEVGRLPARGWLNQVERVFKLAESKRGRRLREQWQIDWSSVLPMREIERSEQMGLVRFPKDRLPLWREKLVRA